MVELTISNIVVAKMVFFLRPDQLYGFSGSFSSQAMIVSSSSSSVLKPLYGVALSGAPVGAVTKIEIPSGAGPGPVAGTEMRTEEAIGTWLLPVSPRYWEASFSSILTTSLLRQLAQPMAQVSISCLGKRKESQVVLTAVMYLGGLPPVSIIRSPNNLLSWEEVVWWGTDWRSAEGRIMLKCLDMRLNGCALNLGM